MSKYIIKNCPAYNEKGCLYSAAIFPDESMQNHYITFAVPCQDCTDCVMKQIVERCKKVREGTADICTNPYEYATYCEARGVLQLLDIEEVG